MEDIRGGQGSPRPHDQEASRRPQGTSSSCAEHMGWGPKRDRQEGLSPNSRDSAQRGRKARWSGKGAVGPGSKEQCLRACGAEPGKRGQSEAGVSGYRREAVLAEGRGTPAQHGRRARTPGQGSAGAGGAMLGTATRWRGLRLPGADSGKALGRVCAPPPEPHPPSGPCKPRGSGRLFPRKGVHDPHQLPGVAESSPRGSPALCPPIRSGRTAGVRYVSRPAGRATESGGGSGVRGPSRINAVTPTSSPTGRGSPSSRSPKGAGAVSPRLGCPVTARRGAQPR